MALIKTKMTQFGIEAEYWKIARVSIDTTKKEICFTLNLYINKDLQEKELDDYTFVSAIIDDFEEDYNKYFREDRGENYKDIYTACYMYAKEKIEFFLDAKDDLEEIEFNKEKDGGI